MTNILDGSDKLFFHSKKDVADYILKHILENKRKRVGTEWEMFFINRENKAITRKDGQKAFVEFKKIFSQKGYKASYLYERDVCGKKTILGLDVRGLGTITPEIGHQFEFSCSVCDSIREVKEKNEEYYDATCRVAAQVNYIPVFKGHIPGYVNSTGSSYRSRSIQWHEYFNRRFGSDALAVCETLDATSSSQVTFDSGSDKFHEYFQALLLIEPALSLHFANSCRPHISVSRLPPSHVKPILAVWHARTPKKAIEAIVDRLMQVETPFLPDANYPQLYKAEPLKGHCPPTVEDLMMQGRLNEKTLNNVGGFLLSRPALRRFSQGLLEMRGVDSQATPNKVVEVVRCATSLVYNDKIREGLLEDYAYLTTHDLYKIHYLSTLEDRDYALREIVGGVRMADFIEDIIDRSEFSSLRSTIQPPLWEQRIVA